MRAHSELSLGSESGSGAAAPKACLACGACCFSELTAYVRVSGEDYSRLGERAAELVLFDGYQAYMQMLDGHCAALVIDLNTEERVCSAYDTRPQICRTLERSSAECWAERTEKAERPLILLQRLLEMSDGSLRVKREGSP